MSYQSLATAEKTEGAILSTSSWTSWLVPRRFRAALSLCSVVLIVLVIFRSPYLDSYVPELKDLKLTHSNASFENLGTQTLPASTQNAELPLYHEEASDAIRWSDFAYVQYVTNANYLCNSLMMLESLHRLKAKADRIMLYPHQWTLADEDGTDFEPESKLLATARDTYGAKLVPITVQTFTDTDDPTWQDSFTKLLAFNQTQYKRVISIDSDGTLLQNMDELFLLPSSPVAMPRAYWLDQPFLSSQVVVIEPSEAEFERINEAMQQHGSGDYDMDILNHVYGNSSLIIPHRRYDLLTAEIRAKDHANYLGSSTEEWNATAVLAEAKFVHFSDWPVRKPWYKDNDHTYETNQPDCEEVEAVDNEVGGKAKEQDCTSRELWLGFYKEFSVRRLRVCGRSYDNMKNKNKRGFRSRSSAARPKWEPVLDNARWA